MAVCQDDRKYMIHGAYTQLIGGVDSCMSGWGRAEGGRSLAYWACKPEDVPAVRVWVRARSEFKRVDQRYGIPRLGMNDHCHVYVVEPGHPALVED